MEKGISEKGSTTINNITLHNLQPIERRCSLGCGRIFETTEGGPRICPECRKKLGKELKTLPKKYRVCFSSNGHKGIGDK